MMTFPPLLVTRISMHRLTQSNWKSTPPGLYSPQTGLDMAGVRGLDIARVHLFFSFILEEEVFKCTLVHEYCKSFTDLDPDDFQTRL